MKHTARRWSHWCIHYFAQSFFLRTAATGLLALIVGACWYWGTTRLIGNTLETSRKRVSSLCNDIIDSRARAAQQKTIENQIARVRADIEEHTKNSYQPEDAIACILDEAKRKNIQVRSLHEGTKSVDKDWFVCRHSAFDVTGSMRDITHFLQALQASPQNIRCSSISIKQERDGTCVASGEFSCARFKACTNENTRS